MRREVLENDPRRSFKDALIAELPALRRFAAALCGNLAVADDLVQDCIERALKQAAQLREPTRLAPWLRSILHNLYVDELRRRRGRGIEKDIGELADDLALSAPSSEQAATTDFVRAMAKLSPEHRQILLLVGLEGLNYREIADELRIPIGTVMSRLARAREKLRGLLGGSEERWPDNVAPFPRRDIKR